MQSAQKLKTTKDLLSISDEKFKVYELLEGKFFVSKHPVAEIIKISRLQENVLASVGIFRNEDEINSPLLSDLIFRVKDVFRK